MLKRHLLTTALLLAAVGVGVGAWLSVEKIVTPNHDAAVEKLLHLQLPDSNGQIVNFAQWRGKPLVVNFWATWCPPCREEMPLLDRSSKATSQVQFVGISIDDKAHVAAFRAQNPNHYPLPISGLEISGLGAELGNKAMALPFTAFIRPDGTLQAVKLGALKEGDLQHQLEQLSAAVMPSR